MTTDPFTKAARAEAEKRHQGDWDPFEQEPVDDWGLAEAERRAFVTGAEWARTHLAAQEPTGSEVEAAFEAFTREHFMQAFSREHGDQGPSSRQSMRAALSAARAARRDEEDRP